VAISAGYVRAPSPSPLGSAHRDFPLVLGAE
jgi:hypothetical protein